MDNDLEVAFSHISNKIRINPDDDIESMCKKMKQRKRLLENLKIQLSQRLEESMIKINTVMRDYSDEQTKQVQLRRQIGNLNNSSVRDLQNPHQVERFHEAFNLNDVELVNKQQSLANIYDQLREETDKMHRTQLKLNQLKNASTTNFQGLQLSIDTLKLQLDRNNSEEFISQLRTVLGIALNQEQTLAKLRHINEAKIDYMRYLVLQTADFLKHFGVAYRVRARLGLQHVEDSIAAELSEASSDSSCTQSAQKKKALQKMQQNLYKYENLDLSDAEAPQLQNSNDKLRHQNIEKTPQKRCFYYDDYNDAQKIEKDANHFVKTRKIQTPKRNKSINNTKSINFDVYDNIWITKAQMNKKQNKSTQSNIKQAQKTMKQETFDNNGNLTVTEQVKANVDRFYQRRNADVDANPNAIIKSKLTKSQLNINKRSKSAKMFDEHVIKSKATKNIIRQDISKEKPIKDKYFDNVLKNVQRAKSRQEKSEQEYLKMKPIDRHERLKIDSAITKLGRMNSEYDQLRQQAHEYVNQNKKAQAKETYEKAYKKMHQIRRLESLIQDINRNMKELK